MDILEFLEKNENPKFSVVEKMLEREGFENTYYGGGENGESYYDKEKERFGLYYHFDSCGKADEVYDWFWNGNIA